MYFIRPLPSKGFAYPIIPCLRGKFLECSFEGCPELSCSRLKLKTELRT